MHKTKLQQAALVKKTHRCSEHFWDFMRSMFYKVPMSYDLESTNWDVHFINFLMQHSIIVNQKLQFTIIIVGTTNNNSHTSWTIM